MVYSYLNRVRVPAEPEMMRINANGEISDLRCAWPVL
jgi:hypothetical protein